MENLDIHIVGIGNLGSALVSGLKNVDSKIKLFLYDQKPQQSSVTDLVITTEIENLTSGVLILSIKPKDIKEFIKLNSNKISEDVLICTVLAGIEISYLEKYFNNKIIRLMPNLSIRNNSGFIPFTKNYDDDYLNFLKVLAELGKISEYDEELFHIITAIYGSGPAWYLELSDKIVEAAVKSGLSHQEATKILKELLFSLPSLLSDEEFSVTVSKIKSPNGTTEAGLNSLDSDSFDKIIINAINSATNRSKTISQEINND